MKTIKREILDKKHGFIPEVARVSDKRAEELVSKGEWNYCPKSVWKQLVRDKNAQEFTLE